MIVVSRVFDGTDIVVGNGCARARKYCILYVKHSVKRPVPKSIYFNRFPPQAAQLAEVYWMSLVRDVPFSQYGNHQDTNAAAGKLLATMWPSLYGRLRCCLACFKASLGVDIGFSSCTSYVSIGSGLAMRVCLCAGCSFIALQDPTKTNRMP